MRRKTTLLTAVFAVVILATAISGCNKLDDTNNNGGTPKIKTYTHPDGVGGTTTETYVYDSQGRISTVTYTGSGTGGDTYAYGSNSVIRIGGDTTILNSQGYDATGTYDTDGHLIFDGVNNYTWTDGNMTTTTQQGGITYTYFTDKTNTIGNENKGMSFLGKDSKNLKSTQVSGGAGNGTFTYQYDSQNRVISVNGNETYTYY